MSNLHKFTRHCNVCESVKLSNLSPGVLRRFRWHWLVDPPSCRVRTRLVGSCWQITHRWPSCSIDYWVNMIRSGGGMRSWTTIEGSPCSVIAWTSSIRRGKQCNAWWMNIERARERIMLITIMVLQKVIMGMFWMTDHVDQ